MARDYKSRAKRPPAKNSPTHVGRRLLLLGFILGLAPGLLIAFLVYLSVSSDTACKPVASPHSAIQAPAASPTRAETKPPAETPLVEPEPAGVERPRFEFYTILPGREVSVPEVKIDRQEAPVAIPRPTPTRTETRAETSKKEEEYLLQAGSFRDYADADRLKARIALLGLIASIQTVTIKQGEQWHRVRVGPVATSAELKRIQTRLSNNKIEGLVIRQAPQNH